MVGSAEVTGVTGPGEEVTALPISNITFIEIDLAHEVIRFTYGDGKTSEFSLVGTTTLETTISGVTGSEVTFVVSS